MKTEKIISAAIDVVYDEARVEIEGFEEFINRVLKERPDQGLEDWSMRVSRDGIEIVDCPYQHWMRSRDWDAGGGYLHNFNADDTLQWLLFTVAENADSLERLLVFHAMLGAGYEHKYQCERFADAIARKPPPRIVLDFSVE